MCAFPMSFFFKLKREQEIAVENQDLLVILLTGSDKRLELNVTNIHDGKLTTKNNTKLPIFQHHVLFQQNFINNRCHACILL